MFVLCTCDYSQVLTTDGTLVPRHEVDADSVAQFNTPDEAYHSSWMAENPSLVIDRLDRVEAQIEVIECRDHRGFIVATPEHPVSIIMKWPCTY